MRFEGSYVIVSHDRDFLDPIVNKVVEFSGGRIKTYPGNVSDYIYTKQKEQNATQAATVSVQQQRKKEESKLSDKERKRIEAEQRQKRSHLTKPLQQKIYKLEKEIEAKEKQKTEFGELMGHADFYKDGEKVKQVTAQYKTLEAELADIYFKWGEVTKELERLNDEFDKKSRVVRD
jgi:ATP-binding cassette subfamily F protein 3